MRLESVNETIEDLFTIENFQDKQNSETGINELEERNTDKLLRFGTKINSTKT
jgi:hypothetical protein